MEISKIKSISLPKKMRELIIAFPTNEKDLLPSNSYFNYVYQFLSEKPGKFLEIGYRKGFFLEVCKTMGMSSIHIDITDKLLRAKPTDSNIALVMDSIKFLESTNEKFGLIFQDGSKKFKHRWIEYQLIKERNLLFDNCYIISDDLHYSDCMKAFNKAKDDLGYDVSTIKVRGGKRTLGVLRYGSNR